MEQNTRMGRVLFANYNVNVTSRRVSMGFTVSRKTVKNLAVRRKNVKKISVGRKNC